MAGFDRGVRPIGDWSMSITLSNASMPSMRPCAPDFRRALWSRFLSARRITSLTSVDLPEPDTPVTATNRPTGISTSMFLQVVLPRAADAQHLVARRRAAPGTGIRRRPDRYAPVTDAAIARDLGRRALGDDLAAVLAGARAHVDHPVGRADGVLVVLDDDHGVADVAQPRERVDQAVVVALVQADRRLVEDVQHADQVRADLRGEPDPLRLAARQRAGGAIEAQVADADVDQEAEPLAQLAHDALGDQGLGLGQLEAVDPGARGAPPTGRWPRGC